MKTRLGCKHNDVLRDSISKLTSGGGGSNMSCRETQCRLESLRALLMALRGSAMDWRRNRIVLMVGTNSGLILSRLWTKVYEIWDDVNDPLYFSTPLPSCLCYVSFRRYSPSDICPDSSKTSAIYKSCTYLLTDLLKSRSRRKTEQM